MKVQYDRVKAVAYARRWALHRNPFYFDFQGIGGDCTNFVSQCLFAGAEIMNYTPMTGWFYRSTNDRTASWAGVDYLYKFLLTNQSVGPYGTNVNIQDVLPGDVIQLGDGEGDFYHTLLVLNSYPHIKVAAHSNDALDRPLDSYMFQQIRCVHIEGVRV